MTRTIEHIMETHAVVAERVAAGKRIWDRKITVDLTSKPTFKRSRNEWVAAIKRSRWYTDQEEGESSDLWQTVDEMKDAENVEHFDYCLSDLYDMADLDRVWITVKR